MKLEKMSVLVVSTHITLLDNSMLITFSGPDSGHNLPSSNLRSAEDEYGYFVWAGSLDDEEATASHLHELGREGYSNDFIGVLQLALENDCPYVRLDRDGPVYKGLPKHNW